MANEVHIVTADHPVEVTGGRMFGPGEQIPKFDAGDEHNAQLLEDGLVTKYDAPARSSAKKSDHESEKETSE